MSSINDHTMNNSSAYSADANPFAAQPPPSHHIHRDSEVLPGARGAERQPPNYDASNTNDQATWVPDNERRFGAGTDTTAPMAGGQHSTSATGVSGGDYDQPPPAGRNAYSEDRPMNVHPTSQGGVAVDGRDDLPEGRAKFTDKLVGKTQKVVGKVSHNAEMHEKGELRESGGKAAVLGEARAPHD